MVAFQMTIPNLTMNTVYEVTIRGATRSMIYRDLKIQGTSTDTKKVLVARDCDKIAPLMPRSSKEFSAGVIAGIVCACFAIMFAIISFVLWRYNTHKHKVQISEKNLSILKKLSSIQRINYFNFLTCFIT